jgi:phosphoenolpyruvate synthase/pyruvate phosphate dikinase
VITKLISKNYQIKDFQHIGLSEYLENNISNKKIIKRRKGWLYHKHEIIYDYQKYFDDKKIKIINPSKKTTDVISGNIGCKGNAKGKARLIFELSELSKIKKGDILVTPMTTPEMIPVLNKISAIITDEGGITCHAAIVSRELKIPCIIGAINATDMIRDNDLLEVDATNGIVRKIK